MNEADVRKREAKIEDAKALLANRADVAKALNESLMNLAIKDWNTGKELVCGTLVHKALTLLIASLDDEIADFRFGEDAV